LGREHHGRESALHVGRSTAVEHAIAHRGHEGIALPLLDRAARDYVGVSGEAEEGALRAPPRPEVLDAAEGQRLEREPGRGEVSADELLAALIGRAHRAAAYEFLRQFKGLRHLACWALGLWGVAVRVYTVQRCPGQGLSPGVTRLQTRAATL